MCTPVSRNSKESSFIERINHHDRLLWKEQEITYNEDHRTNYTENDEIKNGLVQVSEETKIIVLENKPNR
jgi:hypothetical protein